MKLIDYELNENNAQHINNIVWVHRETGSTHGTFNLCVGSVADKTCNKLIYGFNENDPMDSNTQIYSFEYLNKIIKGEGYDLYTIEVGPNSKSFILKDE